MVMSTHKLITEYFNNIKLFGDLYLGRYSNKMLADMLNESILLINKADTELRTKSEQRKKQLPESVKAELVLLVESFSFLKSALIGFCDGETPSYAKFEALITSLDSKYVPVKNMNKQINTKETALRLKQLKNSQKIKDTKERAERWHELLNITSNGICYSYSNHFQRAYAILLDIALANKKLKICPNCELFFILDYGKNVYCSDKCKSENKAKRMKARRNGIYKEAEAISNIYRNRMYTNKYDPHDQGYIKIKKRETREKITAEYDEYIDWKNSLLSEYRAGRITESDCLEQLKDRHKKVKSST